MFRGHFVHNIDAKGRVSLPARFRDIVMAERGGQLVLLPAPFDPCLHLYPIEAWEEVERKIAELPAHDPHVRRFRRSYVSAAHECELDRAGRVLVPPHLREKADLTKDVLWAGTGRIIEVWSKARWDEAVLTPPEDEPVYMETILGILKQVGI